MANLEGQTLGKYQLVDRLGRGGMADVYKGYQPGLDRYVAVKVLHPHLSEDQDFIKRFQREAKGVASLRHPHIVQVFDFDSQGEHYYMVMEFVEGGQSLKEYLQNLSSRGERMPLMKTLDIVAKVADALDYAHQQGMVHRDIKPANILLPTVDKPLLSDFGIARIFGQTGLTAEGSMIGTPAYMAPEQGRGEQADGRSDIYALGIVLYEMLTNHPPYEADTPYAVILKHMNDPLTSPREMIPDLSPAVERVVLRSLAKDPADRFNKAGEMRDTLQDAMRELVDDTKPGAATGRLSPKGTAADTLPAIEGEAAMTQPAGVMPLQDQGFTQPMSAARTGKAARRGMPVWAWGLIGLVVLAAVVGGLLFSGVLGDREAEDEVADAPTGGDSGNSGGSDGGGGEADLPPDVGARLAEGYDLLIHGEGETALNLFNELADQYPDHPDVIGGQTLALMLWDGVEAAEEQVTALDEMDSDSMVRHVALGIFNLWLGEDYQVAYDHLNAAVETCDSQASLCIIALHERANLASWWLPDMDQAFADLDRAITLAPDPYVRADLLDSRADLKRSQADYAGAIADIEESYYLTEDELRFWVLEPAAAYAVIIGDYDRALGYYDLFLQHEPDNPAFMAGRAYVLYRGGNLEEALELAQRALAYNPQQGQAHYVIGLILIEQGEYDAALGELEPLSAIEDTWEYDYPFFYRQVGHEVFYDMARAAIGMGDNDLALEFLNQSISRDDWWPDVHILKAQVHQYRGETDLAREELLYALEIATQTVGREAQADEIRQMIEEL